MVSVNLNCEEGLDMKEGMEALQWEHEMVIIELMVEVGEEIELVVIKEWY